MVELTDEEFEAANELGRVIAETEPHAREASFDRATGRLVIELTNGATYSFPARHVEGLEDASDEAIAAVWVGGGYGLHWDELDVDVTVGGLLAGRFGSERHMAALRDRQREAA